MTRPNVLDTRAMILACLGGVTSAVLGKVLGGAVHLVIPVPMVGSVAAALPRAVVLLVILCRVRCRGALTVAGIAEAAAGVGLGGMIPFSLLAPLAGGVAGDLVWIAGRSAGSERVRLALAGAALCGARMAAVFAVLALVGLPMPGKSQAATVVLSAIVAVNAVLGAVAGLIAATMATELRKAGVME